MCQSPSLWGLYDKVSESTEENRAKLLELQTEHRDLDDVIARLVQEPYVDQLQLKRLKKRKLILKDRIEQLKRREKVQNGQAQSE